MANLPLAFAELLAGGVMVAAGIQDPNGNPINVIRGVDMGKGVAGFAGTSSGSSTSSTGSGSSSGSSTSTAGATAANSLKGGHATVAQGLKLEAMQAEAKTLNGLPYVWGGGHSGWLKQVGYDCSGFVSAVLHAAGYLSAPQTTDTLPTASGMLQGRGQLVTVYDRQGDGSVDHTIIDLGGQWWESGGTTSAGVHQIAAPSAQYLQSFNTILHPAGM